MKQISNKTLITEFYKNVVRLRKSELIANYVHENYMQHSPMGKDGRDGLFEMVEFLKTLPPPDETTQSPIVNILAEGDYVVAHLKLHFMGKLIELMELFRVKDGLAVEHWDVTDDESINDAAVIDSDILNEVGVIDKASIERFYQQKGIIIHHLIIEDEHFAVHAELDQGGKSFALFDVFKVEDKQIAEHHYVKQEVPDKMMHNNGMF